MAKTGWLPGRVHGGDRLRVWDAQNQGLDIASFRGELDLGPARETHIAGGMQHRECRLDVHSRVISPSAPRGAKTVLEKVPAAGATGC